MRVYLAGPYSNAPESNTLRAIAAADEVMRLGFTPFVPHLTHYWHAVSPKDYEAWLAWDMAWLRVCDAVLRLPGESPGADREVALAESLGIPVVHDVSELCRLTLSVEAQDHGHYEP